MRVVDNWHDPESEAGGLLLVSGAWRQSIAQHDTGTWRDSTTIRRRAGTSDSSVAVSVREGRALGCLWGKRARNGGQRRATVGEHVTVCVTFSHAGLLHRGGNHGSIHSESSPV